MSSRNLEINRGDNTCLVTQRKGENATKEVQIKASKIIYFMENFSYFRSDTHSRQKLGKLR